MAYEKRVLVLKQVRRGFTADGGALSGAVYAERLGDMLTVTPRLVGIAPVKEGRYALVLSIEGEIFVAELKGSAPVKIENVPSIRRGLSVLLVFWKGEAKPIAFASAGIASPDYTPLLEAFNGRKPAVPMPPNELPVPMPNVPVAPTVPLPGEEEEEPPFRENDYDDEAIADANYFDDEKVQADGDAEGYGPHAESGGQTCGDEGVSDGFLRPQGSLTYYNSIRGRLEEAFEKFPKDERLRGVFPHSEWVKRGEALIGIVYEGGLPRYLCVAVPAEGEPPEEMQGTCAFVPVSPFSDEAGFYVVFQSADTGEYVTVSQN